MSAVSRAYRGILVNRCPRRWHPVVMVRWPDGSEIRVWMRRASHETGLGACGRGYGTRRELERAIDLAIARCGEPPAFPVLPELELNR